MINKIKNLIVVLITLTFLSQITFNITATEIKLHDFKSEIVPHTFDSRTRLTLTWTTLEELTSLEIKVILENKIIEAPFKWSRDAGKNNANCIWETDFKDGKYYYSLMFTINSSKMGTFYLDWHYHLNDVEYSHPVYISTGNPSLTKEDYSTQAALLISLFTTVGAAVGTYFLFKASQKPSMMEEEDEIS